MAKLVVLDSTAVLAVLFDEPGAARVLDLLPGSLLSAVNLAEIHAHLLLSGHSAAQAWNHLLSLGFEVVPFSQEQARLASDLVLLGATPGRSRLQPLSQAGRACLALAIERSATVYTTNRRWKTLPIDVEVVVIG